MKRRWLTILSLMILIAAVAVGLAAIRKPSLVWASLLFNLSFGLNFLAVVAVIVGRGRTRAAAIGFAVCGWGYFTVTRYFALNINNVMISPPSHSPPLIAEVLAEIAFGIFPPEDSSTEAVKNLIWTLEAMTTIAAGLTGAVFARFVARRPHDQARPILLNMGQP